MQLRRYIRWIPSTWEETWSRNLKKTPSPAFQTWMGWNLIITRLPPLTKLHSPDSSIYKYWTLGGIESVKLKGAHLTTTGNCKQWGWMQIRSRTLWAYSAISPPCAGSTYPTIEYRSSTTSWCQGQIWIKMHEIRNMFLDKQRLTRATCCEQRPQQSRFNIIYNIWTKIQRGNFRGHFGQPLFLFLICSICWGESLKMIDCL